MSHPSDIKSDLIAVKINLYVYLFLTHQRRVGIPSGVPFDSSNNCANFTLDNVDILVDHAVFLKETRKRGWVILPKMLIT